MPTLANLVKNIDPPVEITQAEYNALPEEQKHDGTEYYITDGSSSFQIAATTPAEASDGTGSNVQVELDKRLETSKLMNGITTNEGYALDARYASTMENNAKILVVDCGTISAFTGGRYTVPSANTRNVTSDMIVVNEVFGNPAAMASDWDVYTGDGSIYIEGSIVSGASTTLTLYLQEQR